MPRPKQQIIELTPGMPEKPTRLSEAASRHWDRLIREIQDSGVILIPGYRAAITQAAVLQADLETAWADIQQNGRRPSPGYASSILQCPTWPRLRRN